MLRFTRGRCKISGKGGGVNGDSGVRAGVSGQERGPYGDSEVSKQGCGIAGLENQGSRDPGIVKSPRAGISISVVDQKSRTHSGDSMESRIIKVSGECTRWGRGQKGAWGWGVKVLSCWVRGGRSQQS